MSSVEDAKKYVLSKVVEPALAHPDVSKDSKGKIKRTRQWVRSCREIGNIYDYIARYSGLADENFAEVYKELKKLSLMTIEDLIAPFKAEFLSDLNKRFTLEDLRLRETYSSWDISILSKTYTERQGIYLVHENNALKAILTKVTLEEGVYQNEWLDSDTLKHYMKSRLDHYDENYVVNSAVINSQVPIYVFVKTGKDCVYEGRFYYASKGSDLTQAKWFILKRESSHLGQELLTDFFAMSEEKARAASQLTDDELHKFKLKLSAKPVRKSVAAYVYERNPYVVQIVLRRAKGICELCQQPAPFHRKSDGTPYLEVHHKEQLANGGDDTIENAIAVCPNCHRKEHFGI